MRPVLAAILLLALAGCGHTAKAERPAQKAPAGPTPDWGAAPRPDVSGTAPSKHPSGPLPQIGADGRCPISSPIKFRHYGRALGHGPAYPVGAFHAGRLEIAPAGKAPFRGSRYGGAKVLWIRRGVRGTLLVRGRRLDGPSVVRFNNGRVPPEEFTLEDPTPTRSGWAEYPSYTRLQSPGCYAWTVDGPGVHEVIVFRAVRSGASL